MLDCYEPLVSIIIPVYNGSDYVAEAIDSALAQTYKNIEIIVVNDGSKDNGATERIALSYGDKIQYLHKENGGVSSALNCGIKAMHGEYFSWLSHDDRYRPEKIYLQIEAIRQYERTDVVVCCNAMNIDKNSAPLSTIKGNRTLKIGEINQWHAVMVDLFKHGSFNGCGLLIPKSIFGSGLMFDENLRYAQDALMWYEIFLRKTSLIYINDILVENRIHEKQQTQTGRALFKKDSLYIAQNIMEPLVNGNCGKDDLIYLYLKRNAMLGNSDAVSFLLRNKKIKGTISIFGKISIRILQLYGSVRPLIRKMYYKIFKGIKTK